MGILSGDQQKEPMHYGEVFATWGYLTTSKAKVSAYQTFYNHAGDGDLRKLIESCVQQAQKENTEVESLLKENGVMLPPTPPERPNADLEAIPAGARFNDMEIAAALSADFATGLIACSQIIGQCTREDIATMFAQFHNQKLQIGASILKLNKEKGWLILPPLHSGNKELTHA